MKIKLNEGYALFMQDKAVECGDKSLEYYNGCVRIFTEFIVQQKKLPVEDIYLDDISILDLKAYVVYLKTKKNFWGISS